MPKTIQQTVTLPAKAERWPEGKAGRIELVHVNVADHDLEGVNEGWEKYYWKPWREYLLRKEKAP